jgi:hypothetical protein
MVEEFPAFTSRGDGVFKRQVGLSLIRRLRAGGHPERRVRDNAPYLEPVFSTPVPPSPWSGSRFGKLKVPSPSRDDPAAVPRSRGPGLQPGGK